MTFVFVLSAENSEAKLKEGTFDGPLIRNLMNGTTVQNNMTNIEKHAWISFKNVVWKILSKPKDVDYKSIVADLMENPTTNGS